MTYSLNSFREILDKKKKQFIKFLNLCYDYFISHVTFFLFLSIVLSVTFSIIKTAFFNGYNVDSYQYFALSIEKFFKTGEKDSLFYNYYARNRMVYPFIIAIVHVIFPINISVLSCLIDTVFALLCLWVMKKILQLYSHDKKIINIFLFLTVLSYNWINYTFEILTDFVGLLFFLLMIYFLILFNKSGNFLQLSFSFVFYIYSFLSREIYILAIVIYVFLFKKMKYRIIILTSTFFIIMIPVLLIPEKIPFVNHFIAPSYWDFYLNRQYFLLFLNLQKKWITSKYAFSFLKGLFKVGILPSTILILIVDRKRFNNFFKFVKNKSPRAKILVFWFFFFLFFYTFFYSNINSASGLRYWLPISWIPLFYVSLDLVKKIKKKHLSFLIILFFSLYPLAWSSVEWYVNRETPSGTGSILNTGLYINEMSDKRTISKFDSRYVDIEVINDSYFNTTTLPEAYEEDWLVHRRARMCFNVWFEINSSISIEVRLKSPNNAYWGFGFYSVKNDYSPGYGDLEITMQYINTTTEFQTYYFEFSAKFLLRTITLSLGGEVGSQVVWDYIRVEVN